MTLRIVGAGFGRTGTMSLKLALEELGFRACYHMTELAAHPEHAPLWLALTRGERVDLEQIFAGYAAAVDWPACTLWRELLAAYPDARVILTVRNPVDWYESFSRTILARSENLPPIAEPAHSRALRLEPRGDSSPNIRRSRERREPCDSDIQRSQRGRYRGAPRRQAARLRRGVGMGSALRVPRRGGSRSTFSARECG